MKGMFGLMGNVLILAQKKGLARSVAEEINCGSSARKERLKYEDGNGLKSREASMFARQNTMKSRMRTFHFTLGATLPASSSGARERRREEAALTSSGT